MISRGAPFLSLVLPAYNEEAYLEPAVATVATRLAAAGFPYEILVVDDGSTDATASRAREIAARLTAQSRALDLAAWAEMKVISYPANRGKGHAVRTGVLASTGRFVAFMDVDLSTSPSYIPAFLTEAAAGADVVVATRRAPGATTIPPQGPLRRIGGKVFTRLACGALGLPKSTTDVTCGFKMFRGDVARALFLRQKLDGWGFDAEILFLAHRAGLKVLELPIRWSNRADSRVRLWRDAFRTAAELLAVRRHAASGAYGPPELEVASAPNGDAALPASGPAAGSRAPGAAAEEAGEPGPGVGGRDLRDLLGRP
ncbi:MAG: glycosyltransferase [Acidobacteria bacterium]|nr:glycosyltransferase [Acidobacteriota bacterium]